MKKFLHRITLVAILAALAGTLHAADARKKLVMLIAEPEYQTATTLPEFAAKFLEKDYRVVIVSGTPGANEMSFDHIEEVASADLLLVSVRRRTPPVAELDVVRRYVAAGKPVVGIRTASHAFALGKGQKLGEGQADWPQWDEQVLGGNYGNHHPKSPPIAVAALDAKNPILRGVKVPFTSESTLYRNTPLRAGAHALISGTIPNQPTEPLAWTFKRADGGKTFYTSLGSPTDFQNESFTRLLKNGIDWAAK
jgi:type 1 glutamine amidotransferase